VQVAFVKRTNHDDESIAEYLHLWPPRVYLLPFLFRRRAVMICQTRRLLTAPGCPTNLASPLLRKEFSARLPPERTVLGRPTGRDYPTC
jgi:hypothetical protein